MNAPDGETGVPSGPLSGVTVLEVGGIGPLPFFGMLLADLGARIIRIDRVEEGGPRVSSGNWLYRGRESLTLDLQHQLGRQVLLRLVKGADVLVEGFRPGVAERLGIGPDDCLACQPRLIYGRMTGWGGYGPRADKAGHDINYISLSGALEAIGPSGSPPAVPLNLIGDYGGGAMMLALGVLAALTESRRGGAGQVVEIGMSDGALALMAPWFSMRDIGEWVDSRESNLIDGGAPYYRCYATNDNKYVAVGAIESQFYAELIDGLQLDPVLVTTQRDRSTWPDLHAVFATIFATRSRDEWEAVFGRRDACVTPVLSMAEAREEAHHQQRNSIVAVHGQTQIAPPVRFTRTPSTIGRMAPEPGADTDTILSGGGFTGDEISELRAAGVIG